MKLADLQLADGSGGLHAAPEAVHPPGPVQQDFGCAGAMFGHRDHGHRQLPAQSHLRPDLGLVQIRPLGETREPVQCLLYIWVKFDLLDCL